MRRFSILTESRDGRRRDTTLIIRAADRHAALSSAARFGLRGKLIAVEIVDAECVEKGAA